MLNWVKCVFVRGAHLFGRWSWTLHQDRVGAHRLCHECGGVTTPCNEKGWTRRERSGKSKETSPRDSAEKLSATKLAKLHNTSAVEIQQQLIRLGYIEVHSGLHYFTDLGRDSGGEYRKNHPGANDADGHMVWPRNLRLVN